MTYSVVGTVIAGDGAPGRNAPSARPRASRDWSTIRIAIALLGHACTQAGASPAASRSLHMSHLRTMPRLLLNCGTSYGQVSMQYWQPMHWSSRWRTMPVDGILLVGLHRAAVHAGRVEAVVAGGGHRLLHGRLARAAVQEADAAPGLVVVEAVQAVAGGDAGLAPRAGVEVDAEAVLLAGGRPRERDQRLVAAGGRRVARLVALGEAFDRGQIPLFQQQLTHQKALRGRGHDPSTMRDRRWGYQGRMGFKLLKLLSFLETISRRSRNQPETRRARLLSDRRLTGRRRPGRVAGGR